MKQENQFQHWSLDFAVFKVPWEPREQGTVTEVKFRVLLWVCCCCVVIVLTAERPTFVLLTMSDVNFHGNNYQPCGQPKQCQAWILHYACYQDSGPLLYGPNPKHNAFVVSKRMWCQLFRWDSYYGTSSEPNLWLKSKLEKRNGMSKANIMIPNLWQHCEIWNKLKSFWWLKATWILSPEEAKRFCFCMDYKILCWTHWSPNAYVHHFLLLLVELPGDYLFGLKFWNSTNK